MQYTKKTQEEVREWLFDDLMSQIEPDLTKANRGKTVLMLKSLNESDLKEKLQGYEKAFLEFLRRWPDYVKTVVSDLNADTAKFKKHISSNDLEDMTAVEEQLISDDDK